MTGGEPEAALVPHAVARALGVREIPGRSLEDTLADHLRPKRLLLVVDNCEHLIDPVAHLAQVLLSSCPSLRILATSREPLGIRGEVIWTVSPLSMPHAQGVFSVEEVAGTEAVRLFVDRSGTRLPGFELTESNAGAVGRICRKLDGIPLAIELAAARMGALAVEQVAQRLDDSLKLLTGVGRTAGPRQQTLRATLDWSHDLLSEAARRFFGRLSVFAGGFTLEAAEEVCSGEGIEHDAVVDLLSRLMDKSRAASLLREVVRQGGSWTSNRSSRSASTGWGAWPLAWSTPSEPRGCGGPWKVMHEAYGVRLAPITGYESLLLTARSQLEEETWTGAWAEGKAIPLERAIEYALSEEEEPPTLVAGQHPPADEPAERLTSRELEVVVLVARGLTNRRIASELSISGRTAENHVHKIFKKLGLHSRSQLATWTTERRLLAPDTD